MNRLCRLTAAATAAALVAACGTSSDSSDTDATDLTEVSWGVSVRVPTPGQAPYSSVPLTLGYWEDEGLDVDVQGFEGSGAVFQAIDAGQLDVGQGPPSSLFPALIEGADLKAFYDHVPRNFLLPAVPEDSDIESPADFQGRTVGVASLEAGGVPLLRAMAQQEGLSEDDYDIVTIGSGAEAVSFVERGEVDAVALWDSAYARIENAGIPLRTVANETFESLGFHNAMITSGSFVEEERDVLVKLARGVAKATVFAHENPEAVVRMNWEMYPESKPVGVPEDEALDQGVRELEARSENTVPIDGTWGYSDEDIITQHIEVLLDAGVIQEEVDVDEFWEGDLLDEINDFDEDEVREQARNYEN